MRSVRVNLNVFNRFHHFTDHLRHIDGIVYVHTLVRSSVPVGEVMEMSVRVGAIDEEFDESRPEREGKRRGKERKREKKRGKKRY